MYISSFLCLYPSSESWPTHMGWGQELTAIGTRIQGFDQFRKFFATFLIHKWSFFIDKLPNSVIFLNLKTSLVMPSPHTDTHTTVIMMYCQHKSVFVSPLSIIPNWIKLENERTQHCMESVLTRGFSVAYFPAFGLNMERYDCFANQWTGFYMIESPSCDH